MKIKLISLNQTEVKTKKAVVFFSYETPVAAFINGRIVRTSKKFSATTTKHINKWIKTTAPSAIVSEEPQEFFDSMI